MREDMAQREVQNFTAALEHFMPTGKWPDGAKKSTWKVAAQEKWAQGLGAENVLPTALDVAEEVVENADLLLCIGRHRDKIGSALLRGAMERAIDGTIQLALEGNDQAVRDIYLLAIKSVTALEQLERGCTDAVKNIAKTRPDWPAIISPHGDREERNRVKIATLEIGSNSALNVSRRWSSLPAEEQPSRQVLGEYVNRMIGAIESARLLTFTEFATMPKAPAWLLALQALPQLERSNSDAAKAWFDAGWKILCVLTKDKPQSLPGLDKPGLSQEQYQRRIRDGGKADLSSQNKRGLKNALRNAFMKRFG